MRRYQPERSGSLLALGEQRLGWKVAAHTLPLGLPIDGLLGMDFLCDVRVRIDLGNGSVEIP